jgi:Fe-S cluster assembly protein SufD
MTNTALKTDDPDTGIANLRDIGAKRFEDMGLPDTRWEEFKYTNLAKVLTDIDLAPTGQMPDDLQSIALPNPIFDDSHRLVFVNGQLIDDLSCHSLPGGVTIGSIMNHLNSSECDIGEFEGHQTKPMMAANLAHFSDGLFLHVPDDVEIDAPIELLFYTVGSDDENTPLVIHPRHYVEVEDNARCTIIEHHIGTGHYVTNHALEMEIDDHAVVQHYRIQEDSTDAVHIATHDIEIDDHADYDGFTYTVGAKLSRHEVWAYMDGEHAICHLNGVYLLEDRQLGDTTLRVEHMNTDGQSNQDYKGILDDRAKGVFQGKVHVHRGAQRTDGYQLNNALLLTPTAEIDSKPELEIYADDVKCSHGATTGQIDEDPMFYLRSRGIPESEARILLMSAFLGEAIEAMDHDGMREIIRNRSRNWLTKKDRRMAF